MSKNNPNNEEQEQNNSNKVDVIMKGPEAPLILNERNELTSGPETPNINNEQEGGIFRKISSKIKNAIKGFLSVFSNIGSLFKSKTQQSEAEIHNNTQNDITKDQKLEQNNPKREMDAINEDVSASKPPMNVQTEERTSKNKPFSIAQQFSIEIAEKTKKIADKRNAATMNNKENNINVDSDASLNPQKNDKIIGNAKKNPNGKGLNANASSNSSKDDKKLGKNNASAGKSKAAVGIKKPTKRSFTDMAKQEQSKSKSNYK